MGVLGNTAHERFCKAVHKRVLAGERRGTARTAAYRETIYKGSNPDDNAIAPDARKLANQKAVKGRIQELGDQAAKLAGCDAAWAMVLLKGKADANLDDYLSPPDGSGTRFFDLRGVSREKMGHLSELQIEDETVLAPDADDRRILKTKLKLHDPVAAVGLMARIAGWLSPAKATTTAAVRHEHHISDRPVLDPVSLAGLATAELDELQRQYSETLDVVDKVQSGA